MILNLNIGVLGHVDSGKTTLCKALSEVASTAAFDKNPQSQARGITLDLGFSALITNLPDHFNAPSYNQLQLTFVDCPGHASLLKTIIGGASIIDFFLLVVDVTRGIQTQTAECLVLAEICCPHLLVVFNKVDQLDAAKKDNQVAKMRRKIESALATTAFKGCPMVAVSASSKENLPELLDTLKRSLFLPSRNPSAPFVFAVDHCFAIRGSGTVLTGTVLAGQVKLNDEIEIPKLKLAKKVKSIQMFRTPRENAVQGDRAGLCVTQFDPKLMERGIICASGYAKLIHAAVVPLNRVRYFKASIASKAKFHISVGHETVMAQLLLFEGTEATFDTTKNYLFVSEWPPEEEKQHVFALMEFEKPVLAVPGALLIGSRLDADIHTNSCRLAFWTRLSEHMATDAGYRETFLPRLRVFKTKTKEGSIQRVVSDEELIVVNLFKKESDKAMYIGLRVALSSGEEGVIESTFGQTNKVKVRLKKTLKEEMKEMIAAKKSDVKVILRFKKFLFNKSGKFMQ